jgi:hypothetical protein
MVRSRPPAGDPFRSAPQGTHPFRGQPQQPYAPGVTPGEADPSPGAAAGSLRGQSFSLFIRLACGCLCIPASWLQVSQFRPFRGVFHVVFHGAWQSSYWLSLD